MSELTLIFFEGCPNAARAREVLRLTGRTWHEVRQDDLPPDHPQRAYTSPTILDGARVVFGLASGDAGCSIAPLDGERLLAQLRQTPAQQ
jgi:hypothetical protein